MTISLGNPDEDLAAEYEQAYSEWETSGEAAVWDGVAADGLGEAP